MPGKAGMEIRVGHGYDLHRLEAGIPLTVGGVRIEHDKGLLGHSDGDVLTHAVIDALLGAAGLGDIGQHFPPDDPSLKGADSRKMLERTVELLKAQSYAISNIDCTIVCQEPKLSPHYGKMKAELARRMEVEAGQVNVKAKTAERLGEIGAGEAMAAYAVALIIRDGN